MSVSVVKCWAEIHKSKSPPSIERLLENKTVGLEQTTIFGFGYSASLCSSVAEKGIVEKEERIKEKENDQTLTMKSRTCCSLRHSSGCSLTGRFDERIDEEWALGGALRHKDDALWDVFLFAQRIHGALAGEGRQLVVLFDHLFVHGLYKEPSMPENGIRRISSIIITTTS